MPEKREERRDYRVVLRPTAPGSSHIFPEEILAGGLTWREAQARAKQARRNYLFPNTVEVR